MKTVSSWLTYLSRLFLAATLFLQWTLTGSNAHAISFRSMEKIVHIGGQELRMVVNGAGRNMAINLVDDAGKIVKSLVTQSTPRAQLMTHSPSNLIREFNLGLRDHLAKTRGLHPSIQDYTRKTYLELNKFSFKTLAVEKLKRFPIESFGFFIAIGAIQTAQLAFNEAQNPLAYEHHIEHSTDPIGMLGFYSFMLANGAVAEPLMSMVKDGRLNKRIRPYVNFMGMSAGMVASNIVHELGHWPGLWQCAKDTLAGKKKQAPDPNDMAAVVAAMTQLDAPPPSCDEAYAQWVDRGGAIGIWHEWAPGLASLIASTALSGALASGVQWGAGQALKFLGIQLGTLLVPGGIGIKIVRAGLWIAQMTVFTGIDEAIRPLVTTPYRNWQQGGTLNALEEDLVFSIAKSWKAGFEDKSLNQKIDDIHRALKKWRQMNLEEVEIAHSNWMSALNNMSGSYNVAETFYDVVLGEMWNRKNGTYQDFIYNIARTYPLHGITPKGVSLSPENLHTLAYGVYRQSPTTSEETRLFLDQPEDIEMLQMLTVADAATWLTTQLKNSSTYQGMDHEDSEILYNIGVGLRSNDPVKIGQTMTTLNRELGITYKNPYDHRIGRKARQLLLDTRKMLGDPRPLLRPGEGFARYYILSPTYENANRTEFKKVYGSITPRNFVESMLSAMFWGPDVEKGQAVIQDRRGFKSVFNPPRIRIDDNKMHPRSITGSSLFTAPVYNTRIGVSRKEDEAPPLYPNIHSFLLDSKNIRSTVLGATNSTPTEWWKKHVETQYVQALADYENKYQVIVNRLVNRMWREDLSFWRYGPTNGNERSPHYGNSYFNSSNASNAIIPNLMQETRLYMMIVGEIMKIASYLPQNNHLRINSAAENPPLNLAGINFFHEETAGDSFLIAKVGIVPERKPKAQLLSFFMKNNVLDFRTLINAQPLKDPVFQMGKGTNSNLSWQNMLLTDIQGLTNLLRQIKPNVPMIINDGSSIDVVTSQILNSQLEEAKKKSHMTIDQLRALLGIEITMEDGSTVTAEVENKMTLLPGQLDLAKNLLKKIEENIHDMTQVGMIANAVSYREIKTGGLMKSRCSRPTGMLGSAAFGFVANNMENCQ